MAPKGWMGLTDGVTLTVAGIVPETYIVLTTGAGEDSRLNVVWSFHL